MIGEPPGLNALAATSYPSDLRSTGIGAALFRVAAIPALVSTLVVLAMRAVLGPGAGRPAPRCGPEGPASG